MHQAYGNTKLARRLLWSAFVLDGFMLFFTMCAAAARNNGGIMLLMLSMAVITGLALWFVVKAGLWFEWQLERVWKRVCAGLGGNFVGEGRARLQPGLSYDFYGSMKKTKVVRDKTYPKFRQVRGNREAWTAIIRPFYGQNLDDYTKQADRFAMAFHVRWVGFDLAENGLIRIRAGQVPMPQAFSYDTWSLTDGR